MSEVQEDIGYVKWGREEQIKKLDEMKKFLKINDKRAVMLKFPDGNTCKYGLDLALELIKNGKAELV